MVPSLSRAGDAFARSRSCPTPRAHRGGTDRRSAGRLRLRREGAAGPAQRAPRRRRPTPSGRTRPLARRKPSGSAAGRGQRLRPERCEHLVRATRAVDHRTRPHGIRRAGLDEVDLVRSQGAPHRGVTAPPHGGLARHVHRGRTELVDEVGQYTVRGSPRRRQRRPSYDWSIARRVAASQVRRLGRRAATGRGRGRRRHSSRCRSRTERGQVGSAQVAAQPQDDAARGTATDSSTTPPPRARKHLRVTMGRATTGPGNRITRESPAFGGEVRAAAGHALRRPPSLGGPPDVLAHRHRQPGRGRHAAHPRPCAAPTWAPDRDGRAAHRGREAGDVRPRGRPRVQPGPGGGTGHSFHHAVLERALTETGAYAAWVGWGLSPRIPASPSCAPGSA